jgi:uncharacterized membrane protein
MQASEFPETTAEPATMPRPEFDHFAMERVVLFSDAVYAIIITLLALDVRLPEQVSSADIGARLVETLPKLAAYALSFLVVATLWRVHLRRFRYLVGIDSRLISGNMLQLMVTGLLPFSTSVLNAHLGFLAIALYAVNIIAISTIAWLSWFHVRRQPALVRPDLTARVRREDDRRTWITIAVFALSIPIAWWNPSWGAASWALLLPGNWILSALERRSRANPSES